MASASRPDARQLLRREDPGQAREPDHCRARLFSHGNRFTLTHESSETTPSISGHLWAAPGVVAAFGSFKVGHKVLDHTSNMSVQRLVELYAEAGLVGFKVHKRVGGYCIRPANKSIVLLTEHA